MAQDKQHGKSEHGGAHAEHHGIGRYVAIWLILLGFTALTVATGKTDLGQANIFIAMAIALTKATLVVLFFMHLWDEGGVNRLVFVVSVFFAVLLMLGVFGDVMTRLPSAVPNGGPLPATVHGDHPVGEGAAKPE